MKGKGLIVVPAAFQNYFIACSQISAALVGLLFIAVSVAPQRTVATSAPAERRAVALSTYTALLNAFFLALVAILPQSNLGSAALVLSIIGLTQQATHGWDIFRHTKRTWLHLIRGIFLIVVGLIIYGIELYNAVLILHSPGNAAPIASLASLLIWLFAFSLARAWQLIGGQTHGVSEWLSPLHTSTSEKQPDTAEPISKS